MLEEGISALDAIKNLSRDRYKHFMQGQVQLAAQRGSLIALTILFVILLVSSKTKA